MDAHRVTQGEARSSLRPPPLAPRIPDHEVLRCIGRGSYGEVWMARAVTGALRAVKVVRREDFELDRTFEREFEGTRSFEPISRSHPGVIDILHVGRHPVEGFYYYVMELADDRYRGRNITPAEYEPRTLGTDKHDGERLNLDRIIEVGLLMSDALAHLHRHGLIHRDVKPSNIIFVDGVAQLADIGLVAACGQRTYVGTEGFVPPEGPGTPQADTYSLGMVLYELSTGRDRLEFPAVPDNTSWLGDRRKWRALNEVVCRACAPDPRQRYAEASHMADDLRRVLEGRTPQRGVFRRKRTWALAAIFLALAGLVSQSPTKDKNRPNSGGPSPPLAPGAAISASIPSTTPIPEPPAVEPAPVEPPDSGVLSLTSDPPGASIFVNGEPLGSTPRELTGLPAGEVSIVMKAPGYREFHAKPNVSPDVPAPVHAQLEQWRPPVAGEAWKNSLGMAFDPRGREHIAVVPATREHYVMAHGGEFPEGEVLPWSPPDGGPSMFIVSIPRPDAESFCEWLEQRDREQGFFGLDHYYRLERVEEGISPTIDETTRHNLAFRLVAGLREFGDVRIESEPPGATVIADGKPIGFTPLTLAHHLSGRVTFELQLAGHNPESVTGDIEPGDPLVLKRVLTRNQLAVFDQEWQNGLGMIFRPIGGIQFCVWETRVKDFDAFVAATGHPHASDLDQAPDHPVVSVTRDDAVAFCRWLTKKERAEGRLEARHQYRLPTDREWSLAAGLASERGDKPSDRHARIKGVYGWGFVWPPPPTAGNFADQSAYGRVRLENSGDRLLMHDDHFVFTAPVGTFSPNGDQLFDLAGNVWEWVAEDFGGETGTANYSTFGVLRGSSWADYRKESLLLSFRKAVGSTFHDSTAGFRVVLAPQ